MPNEKFVVKVILRSKQTITSPTMSREDAESALQQINDVRKEGGDVELPWLSVGDMDIEAAHLEEHLETVRERLG